MQPLEVSGAVRPMYGSLGVKRLTSLTLILPTWRIWWAPKNVNKWQMGFSLAFKGLMHKFNNNFITCPYMFRALCAHHLEVKIVLYSIWYHHKETGEWSKVTKTQLYICILYPEHILFKKLFVVLWLQKLSHKLSWRQAGPVEATW